MSVCLSVNFSCPLNNSDTVQDIFMKLGININHHQMMCREQERTHHLHFLMELWPFEFFLTKMVPSFAMDTAHNFRPEYLKNQCAYYIRTKYPGFFFPHPANVLIASFDDKHTGYIDSMFSCFGKNLKTGGIILSLISSTVCLKY